MIVSNYNETYAQKIGHIFYFKEIVTYVKVKKNVLNENIPENMCTVHDCLFSISVGTFVDNIQE